MSSPRPASATSDVDWIATNQAYLDVALQGLRLRLQRRVRWLRHRWQPDPLQGHPEVISDQQADGLLAGEDWTAEHRFYTKDEAAVAISHALRETEQQLAVLTASTREAGIPLALGLLARFCGLTTFEQQVVLLCFAPECDPAFAELYAYVQDHPSPRYSRTPHLAVSLFVEDEKTRNLAANSFLPDAPLRRFALLNFEPGPFPATALTARPLHLAARIADYLRGVNRLDTQVAGLLQPVHAVPLAASQQDLAKRLVQVLQAKAPAIRALNLVGASGVGKQAVAQAVCAQLGMQLARVVLTRLPTAGPEQRRVFRRSAARSRFVAARLLCRYIHPERGREMLGSRYPCPDRTSARDGVCGFGRPLAGRTAVDGRCRAQADSGRATSALAARLGRDEAHGN